MTGTWWFIGPYGIKLVEPEGRGTATTIALTKAEKDRLRRRKRHPIGFAPPEPQLRRKRR